MDTQSEEYGGNTDHHPDNYNIKNESSIQGQVIGDYANVHIYINSDQNKPEPSRQCSSDKSDPSPVSYNLKRPTTIFLSYDEQNANEVAMLGQELKLRGVSIVDLHKDIYTTRDTVREIAHEVDALLIYMTRESLKSSLTWDTIIQTAQGRYEGDSYFSIIPVLRDITSSDVQRLCISRGLRSLKDFKCYCLPDPKIDQAKFREEHKRVAKRVLQTTLQHRLRRMQVGNDYEPRVRQWTFGDRPAQSDSDLDLNWYNLFLDKTRLPSQTEWQEMLFPALLDMKHVLSELPIKHKLHISLQSTIPAALALGYIFRGTTSFTLLPWNKAGEQEWSSAAPITSSDPLHLNFHDEEEDSHIAVVELAIPQLATRVADDTSKALFSLGLSYRYRLQFSLPGGPDHINGVKDASHAQSIAHQIGKELRSLCGKGVAQIHLFAAIPAALAVLIGHQLNAICPVIVYEYNSGTYELAYTLSRENELR